MSEQRTKGQTVTNVFQTTGNTTFSKNNVWKKTSKRLHLTILCNTQQYLYLQWVCLNTTFMTTSLLPSFPITHHQTPDCVWRWTGAIPEMTRHGYIWLEYEVGPPTWLYSDGWSKLPWLYGCWLKVSACFSVAAGANLEVPLCQLVSLKTNQMFPAQRTKLRKPNTWRERQLQKKTQLNKQKITNNKLLHR